MKITNLAGITGSLGGESGTAYNDCRESNLFTGTWQIVHRSFDAFGLRNSFPYKTDGPQGEFKGDTTATHLLAAPILYAGGEWDEHAQLYVLSGRFYDPYSGRWVTDGGGDNGYQFAENNPVRERVIGETVYSGTFDDYSYYLNPLNNDPGVGGYFFGAGKALGWTAFAVAGGYAAGSLGAAAVTAGAELAGTTVGTYLGIQAGIGAVETAIEVGATSYFGGEVSFSGTAATFGKNFAVNSVTGGLGGFFARQAIEIGADTTLDVARGQDALSSLAINTVGSLGGEVVFRGLGRAANSHLAHQSYAYAGGFQRGYFSAGQSSIYAGMFTGDDIGRRLAAGHRMGIEEAVELGHLSTRSAPLRGTIHHIATIEDKVYTPQFQQIFNDAGLDLVNSPFNRTRLAEHVGPHGKFTNQVVYRRLYDATSGLERGTAQYRGAVLDELWSLRRDIHNTPFGDLYRAPASQIDVLGKF